MVEKVRINIVNNKDLTIHLVGSFHVLMTKKLHKFDTF
jgi:hypothetical protein